MPLKIRHALLEVNSSNHLPNLLTKQSAIIIDNEIVISTGRILQSYIHPTVGQATKVIDQLQQCQLIDGQNNCNENRVLNKFLNSLIYLVTYDCLALPKSNKVVTQQQCHLTRNAKMFKCKKAQLLYIFNVPEISAFMHQLFTNNYCKNNYSEGNILLSSFLILTIQQNQKKVMTMSESVVNNIIRYLRYITSVHILDDVLCMCTPFGMENFFKTISLSKISNVLNRKATMFALSNNLPLGCEGSAVFNKHLHLIGIIVCTSFQHNNQNIAITLAASFPHLLKYFLKQINITCNSTIVTREPTLFSWEHSLVVIRVAGNQGTGTFIQLCNKCYILTCSHILYAVDAINCKIHCRSIDGEFKSDIIWRNPQYDAAFDIALLSVPHHIPKSYCARISQRKPTLVKQVYNAGFPCYVNFILKYDFNPCIFQGRIIRCTPSIIMSDGCVQAGQSGGPMFDEFGHLLGVCVSNFKLDKLVYPNINCAIPLYAIRCILEQYAKSNDVTVLNNLLANPNVQKEWSLAVSFILGSKL